jgi:DnaJ like chaperone protein
MNLKKWISLAIVLTIFYYVFVVNFFVVLGIFASLYVAFKIFKIYSLKKLNKLMDSKELFAQSELGLFIALVAKVAKADGRVSELEAQLIKMMFDDISKVFVEKQKAREMLKEIFNEAKMRSDDTVDVASLLNDQLGKSRLKRRRYVSFLIQLAYIDSGIGTEEERLLRQIVQALQMPASEYEAILKQFTSKMSAKQNSMNIDDACKILGVNKDDDMESIKKRYRKLVREYHPDIIKSQDKDENYMEEATAKTQEINQAYQVIKDFKK